MSFNMFFLLISRITTVWLLYITISHILVSHGHLSSGRSDQEIALHYLRQFGYISETVHDNEGMANPHIIQGALKSFQRSFHLNASGKLDEPTRILMSRPRCGNKDRHLQIHFTSPRGMEKLRRVKRFLIEDREKVWPREKVVTYKLKSYPTEGQLSKTAVHKVFHKAFNTWSEQANIDFEEILDYREPDIVIEFGRGHHGDSIPFDGPGKVLAHAFYPNPGAGLSRAGDVHFDDEELWSIDPSVGKDLLAVAVHELGHSLGLGHSNVESAIMYPYYTSPSSIPFHIQLSADDIAGIRSLYGPAPRGKYLPPVDHIPFIPPTRSPLALTTLPTKPTFGFCNISLDAIVEMRGLELQIFSNKWLWRIVWSRTPTNWYSYEYRDGPELYSYYWPALPSDLGHIDAALEGQRGRIWVFRGKRFWTLKSNTILDNGVPRDGRPISELGLPRDLEKVDTMFYWNPALGKSSKHKKIQIFLFASDLFWEFFEDKHYFGRVSDSPRLIKDVWRGLPTPVDAAFTRHNGETYFFKGNQYYSFNAYRMRVRPGYPQVNNLPWLGCAHSHEKRVQEDFPYIMKSDRQRSP